MKVFKKVSNMIDDQMERHEILRALFEKAMISSAVSLYGGSATARMLENKMGQGWAGKLRNVWQLYFEGLPSPMTPQRALGAAKEFISMLSNYDH